MKRKVLVLFPLFVVFLVMVTASASAQANWPPTRHAIHLSGGVNTADVGFVAFEHNTVPVVTTAMDYRVVATVYTIVEGYPYFDAVIQISAGPGWIPEVYKGTLVDDVTYVPCEHLLCDLPSYAVFKVAFPAEGPVEVGMYAPRPPYRPRELRIEVHAFDPAMTHWEGAVACVRNSLWGYFLPLVR